MLQHRDQCCNTLASCNCRNVDFNVPILQKRILRQRMVEPVLEPRQLTPEPTLCCAIMYVYIFPLPLRMHVEARNNQIHEKYFEK